MAEVMDVDSLKEREGLVKNLGIEYVETRPERVVMRMPVDRRHVQPMGFLHGGASVVLAETVATVGAWLLFGELPAPTFWAGAPMVLAGVWLATTGSRRM